MLFVLLDASLSITVKNRASHKAVLDEEPPDSVEEVFQLATALEAKFLQGLHFDLTYPLMTYV